MVYNRAAQAPTLETKKVPMQRRHFLYLLIAMLALPPLAITGKLAWRQAIAQNLSGGGPAAGAPSNVRGTRHNFSNTVTGGGTAPTRQTTSGNTVTTEAVVTSGGAGNNEVCVFCHTPHGANTEPNTPLWNRALSGATYTPYSSSSLQATDIDVTAAALAAPSKLCLSCHDGTIALGNVANTPGPGSGSAIALSNANPGTGGALAGSMPYGRGRSDANHGFTRRLGDDLRNDHPISFTYDANLASLDGELRSPPAVQPNSRPLIANRAVGSPKPYFPLVDNKVQCTTCHDPHKQTQKFLNTNRLVRTAPETIQTGYTDWTFDADGDQICVACHTRLGKAWAQSAHANSTVKDGLTTEYSYSSAAGALRDFPTGTKVWQAGCLNCHDPHTVAGSRRLLREGSNSATANTSGIGYTAALRIGILSADDYATTSALENTCFQCHSPSGSSAINVGTLSATGGVPDIQTEFGRTTHMPITHNDQGQSGAGNTSEVHDITDKDTIEPQTQLGYYAPENRHVECTDCHNPHRVVKADTYLGANLSGGDVTRRTHVPARGTSGEYGNIASGVLRGAWGVEPSYTASGQTTVTTSSAWMSNEEPSFTVKKGDPAGATALPVGTSGTNTAAYLTREYQLCFKCHSSYANGPLATDFPNLKGAANGRGGTPTGTNGMTRYTDVAKEFAVRATDPPSTGLDQGEYGECGDTCTEDTTALEPSGSLPADTGNNPDGTGTQNHRSWHPVVFPTGRTADERRISSATGNIRAPFRAKLGTQTMHCSDCHGAGSTWTPGSGPILTTVQGPHGSDNNFILRSTWSNTTTISGTSTALCYNCHNPTVSGTQGVGDNLGGNQPSGFNAASTDSQGGHGNAHDGKSCMHCHVAVPHGWKNKALLVNLNCIGPEGGQGSTCVNIGDGPYNNAPYYRRAGLRVRTWVPSGNWAATSCGVPGGASGKTWMKDNAGCDYSN